MSRRLSSLIILIFLTFGIILVALEISKGITIPKLELPKRKEKVVILTDAIVTIVPEQFQRARVVEVVDGDTIKLDSGKTVRYIGIDTPETKHPQKGVECFGKEASEKNKQLVDGREILLQKDVSETDRYDRLLRYVYLPNPTNANQEAIFINRYLVEEGYAHAITYPPDVRFRDEFRRLEQEAREKNKGLWNKCDNE